MKMVWPSSIRDLPTIAGCFCSIFLIVTGNAAELNVLAFGTFSQQTDQGLEWFTGRTRSVQAMFPLAIKHFNDRDGSIITEFATRTCHNFSLNLTDYVDDRGSPTKAMKLLVAQNVGIDNIHAVIGPVRSVVAQPLAATLSAMQVPIISHWATSSVLSNPQTYPFFARTCPSDDAKASVAAEIFSLLSLKRVGMFYINDNYGLSWKNSLLVACEQKGINLIYVAYDDTTGRDLDKSISDGMLVMKRNKLNAIFFVFGLQPGAVLYLAKAAKQYGMLTDQNLYLHSINDLGFTSDVFPENVSLIREFLRGSIAIQDGVQGLLEVPDADVNPVLDAFKKLWPTFNESDVNFKFPTHTDVFDHSRFLFPPGYFASTVSHVFHATAWAYDTVATLGLAACEVYNALGEEELKNGTSLLAAILNVTFQGVSGKVRFAETGDRDPATSSYVMQSVLFDPKDGSVKYKPVGWYLPSVGAWTVHLEEAVFRDGTSQVPSDVQVPFHDEQHLPQWTRALGYVEASIGLALGLYSLVWLCFWHRHLVVVQSQPVFMHILALGLLCIASSVIPLTMEEETGDCMAFPFLYSIGLTLACSSISAKNLRVGVLWYRLRERKQDRGFLYLALITFIVILNLIFLLAWLLVAPLEYQRFIVIVDINGLPEKSYGACAIVNDESNVFMALVLVHLAVVLVWTGLVSVWVHHAPEQFQESKWTALGACSLGQVYLLGIPIVVLVYNEPIPRFMALSTMCFLTALVLFGAFFLPKMVAVSRHPELKIASSSSSSPRQAHPPPQDNNNNHHGRQTGSPHQNPQPGAILLRFSPIPSQSQRKTRHARAHHASPPLNQQLRLHQQGQNPMPTGKEGDPKSPKARAHRSDHELGGDGMNNTSDGQYKTDERMIPTTLRGNSGDHYVIGNNNSSEESTPNGTNSGGDSMSAGAQEIASKEAPKALKPLAVAPRKDVHRFPDDLVLV